MTLNTQAAETQGHSCRVSPHKYRRLAIRSRATRNTSAPDCKSPRRLPLPPYLHTLDSMAPTLWNPDRSGSLVPSLHRRRAAEVTAMRGVDGGTNGKKGHSKCSMRNAAIDHALETMAASRRPRRWIRKYGRLRCNVTAWPSVQDDGNSWAGFCQVDLSLQPP
jgi:hypothetical protein